MLKAKVQAISHDLRCMLASLLPEGVKGRVDFYRFPKRRLSWGGPFNGQEKRQAIFNAVISTISPGLILETGTFLGTTTEFMAQLGIPIVTIESSARNYGFARTRLRSFRNVQLRLGDSRLLLRGAIEPHRIMLQTRPLFAYLDAHWNADLPLAEELENIFLVCPNAVVMIDDFRVPDDSGYQYDDYGSGNALTPGYIAPLVERFGLDLYYPSSPSSEETGLKRGCVILAKRQIYRRQMEEVRLLRILAPLS